MNIPSFAVHYPIDVLTLAFEQYMTFLHRPTINGGPIAKMTSNTPMDAEHHGNMISSVGVPVYVYYKDTLVHEFKYSAHISQLLGYGPL